MMLISRSLEIFTWVLWSTKVLDRGVNGDCTFSRWQATCCLQATTFRSSNLHVLDRTVRPWELVQDQITFKRAYMQPMELSHKSQASVRWSLIYSYLQSSLRRPKLMRPNQVGLYIYLSHRRNWIHTIASSNSKSLPCWLSCEICYLKTEFDHCLHAWQLVSCVTSITNYVQLVKWFAQFSR